MAGFLLAAGSQAAAQTLYEIVPGESELRILVFRAGALARFGHNHVISTRELSGTVTVGATPADSRFEMTVPVQAFAVDEPSILEEEGSAFSGDRSEDDIRSTRRNMLGPELLHAEAYEAVRVVSAGISGEFPQVTVHARIAIGGSEHTLTLPAFVSVQNGRLVTSGSAEIAHSELGLSPFEAAFGAVRVAENMSFRYRIVAQARPDAIAGVPGLRMSR